MQRLNDEGKSYHGNLNQIYQQMFSGAEELYMNNKVQC